MNDESKQPIRFAEFELDAVRHLLRRDGETLALNAKAFDLLVYLTKNAGRVVTKDEILDAVWENQFVEEANLKVQISALRKALGERADEHRFLVTIPGKGYKFVGEIFSNGDELIIEKHRFSHLVVEDLSEPPAVAGGLNSITKKNKFSILAIFALAFSLTLGGYWLLNRMRENRVGSVPVLAEEKQPKMRRLTNQGRVNRAKISPDGRFFAYTQIERGSYRTEIRVGQLDSASDVSLRPFEDVFHHPISFSADGNWLYYVNTAPVSEAKDTKGEFYKIPVLGGVPQKLGDEISIYSVLSPDEKQIAFPRNNREKRTSAIIIANTDGTNERELVTRPLDEPFTADALSWSADGQTIAASAAGKKNVSDKIYEVFTIQVSDGSIRQLTALEWSDILWLEWLKDASGIVALAREKNKNAGWELWMIDGADGKARRISRDVNSYSGSLSVSADSRSLIAVQSENESNLWLAPADNLAAARQISFSTSGRQIGWRGMDFTPDGKIIHTAWIDQSLTLWEMNADGSNAKQLTSIGFIDEKPAVTSDGRFIVFQSNRSGAGEIWRMDADGGNLLQLTKTGGNTNPSVTPDGVWVIYRHAEDGDGSLWRVPLTGGEPFLLTDKNVFVPFVSPDGKYIACGLAADEKMRLAVFSSDGGEPLKLFDLPPDFNFRYRLRWSPDGRFISYADEADGIWMQDFAGGAPVRLKNIPNERTFTFGWSPDGKQFAYGRSREVREAVLITDFR